MCKRDEPVLRVVGLSKYTKIVVKTLRDTCKVVRLSLPPGLCVAHSTKEGVSKYLPSTTSTLAYLVTTGVSTQTLTLH